MDQINSTEIQVNTIKRRQRIKATSRILPSQAIDVMNSWYEKHYSNPYPTYREFEMLANMAGITVNQVKQWLVNVRRRTKNEFRRTRQPYKSSTNNRDQQFSNVNGQAPLYPVYNSHLADAFVYSVPLVTSPSPTRTSIYPYYASNCTDLSQNHPDLYYNSSFNNNNYGYYSQSSLQSPTSASSLSFNSANNSSFFNNSYGFDTFAI